MRLLGAASKKEASAYFTGGASAVLMGWRAATIDVDVAFVPDSDDLLRALPDLKEQLELNVELASPSDFLPELPGWKESTLRELFDAIVPELYRYPAVDPPALGRAVVEALAGRT